MKLRSGGAFALLIGAIIVPIPTDLTASMSEQQIQRGPGSVYSCGSSDIQLATNSSLRWMACDLGHKDEYYLGDFKEDPCPKPYRLPTSSEFSRNLYSMSLGDMVDQLNIRFAGKLNLAAKPTFKYVPGKAAYWTQETNGSKRSFVEIDKMRLTTAQEAMDVSARRVRCVREI